MGGRLIANRPQFTTNRLSALARKNQISDQPPSRTCELPPVQCSSLCKQAIAQRPKAPMPLPFPFISTPGGLGSPPGEGGLC